MAYYAGIDVGATHLRGAIADEDGTVLSVDRRPTPVGPNGLAITETLLDALRTVCDDVDIAPTQIRAAGIGSIGPLDLARGSVIDPSNLPEAIEEIPLRDPIIELIGSERVYLLNDTTAGVVGERFYSDPNPDDMVYITISSGIGAGVSVDGDVLMGWDGNAGEVGHMTVDPQGRMTCGCGIDGHWEAYCSGSNLPDYARYLHDTHDIDTDLSLADEDLSAADLFDNPDDPLVSETLDRMAKWNAIGIVNVIHAFAPLVIAIGGAVALNNQAAVIEPIKEMVPELVFTGVPEIRATTLGAEVVLHGAIASALMGGLDT